MLLLLAATAAGCANRATDVADPAASTPPPRETPLPVGLARDASPQFRAVTEALVAAMRSARIPGAALGILSGGREEHATVGLASLSSLRPVTPETLFQIGSLTKTYTATAIWRLVDDGKLQLQAPVRRYLRGLRCSDEQVAATVTVANLLEHTAGWYGDDFIETGDDSDALSRFVETRLPELPQLFGCGEFFSYNNAAFQLLGRIVEVSAGTDYNDAMQQLVLGPLGLTKTVLDRGAVLGRPYADGHTAMPINGRDSVAVQSPLWVPRNVDPAGGIWSTTRDVLRYARMHVEADRPGAGPGRPSLLKPASIRAMQEPAVKVPGLELSMGRSWFVQDIEGLRVISHNGDTLGQHTAFVAVPERGFALILMLNAQPGQEAELSALDAALTQYRGLAGLSGKAGLTPALLVPADAPTVTLPRSQLNDYAGRYVDPGVADDFRVAGDGLQRSSTLTPAPGSWQADIPPPAPNGPESVTFLDKDLGIAAGMRMPFVRNAEGKVGWVAEGLRLRPRT